jgi:hypothetical protein
VRRLEDNPRFFDEKRRDSLIEAKVKRQTRRDGWEEINNKRTREGITNETKITHGMTEKR